MKKNVLVLLGFLFIFSNIYTQSLPPYKNASLPIEKRVSDLLERMTPEEKFWQLFMIPGDLDHLSKDQYKTGIFGFQVSAASTTGDASQQLLRYGIGENPLALTRKINAIQQYFRDSSRLGIPIIPFDEALHGLVRDGATVFPQAIALAATWDIDLMHKVATAIAEQTKARGIRQILTPVINIASDVRWGRTEETYGEDPFLTSEMGVAFVSAFEKMNIITTPKHFIANVGDGGRDSYPIHFNDRLMEEIYFAPFKAAFSKGGSRSVMTSYNSLDGTACSANNWLLNEKLKKEWGFKGFVISDASAVGGANVLHYTAKDYSDAGKLSIIGGLDVIFQTAFEHSQLFIQPFLNGEIKKQIIDDAVSRVLTAKFELGLFEQPLTDESIITSISTNDSYKVLAKTAALKSIVLLKNEHQILPIREGIKTIAVIGNDAVEARLGGYSGPGNEKISILDGIKARAGKFTHIIYKPGCGRVSEEWTPIEPAYLSHIEANKESKGLEAFYYNNVDLNGDAVFKRTDPSINFNWTLFPPDPKVNLDFYSIKWSGILTAPTTGNFNIGLDGNDGYRLFLNDELIVDNWTKQSYNTYLKTYHFQQGKKYKLRVEFFEPNGNAHIKLVWNVGVKNDWKFNIKEAVDAAAAADLAVIVTGIKEGEFQDRAMLGLPGHQEELINQIAAIGKPVIVVLTGGSAITMHNWLSKVKGVLDVWYPGEQGGHAVAAVLFGDENPAGRLPITFPQHEAQLPLVYNHKPTGRGDDYNNLSGLPLFPFGFGLSYTQFEYSNFKIDQDTIGANDSTWVHFTLKNIGNKEGDEVVQLYIRDLLSSVSRPVMELKGFQRIHLKPAQSKQISFKITPDLLSMLNANLESVVEPGDFRMMIGASSRDIRLKQNITVHQ